MGKTIVITGASDGVGRAAAQVLASRGHTTVIVGRSREKTEAVAAEVGAPHHCCDFDSLDDVRGLAAELLNRYDKIDVLCNNAGLQLSGARQLTRDGYERTLQVNHLAPALLTRLLLDRLIESKAAVIATSSSAARLVQLHVADLNGEKRFRPLHAYSETKLANVLFTRELHRRYRSAGLAAASFEPGSVASNFANDSTAVMRAVFHSPLRKLLRTPEQGADTLVWLADSAPGVDWPSGEHFRKRRVAKTHRAADDVELRKVLWQHTYEMLDRSQR
ncbi:short-chain dehydrogenase [Mycolicibacterium novocastrense]|uniref:Retinol dehydrogenase 14 n=1 Tax=Mycolicibacterium novocastrense TaxID=59813 RepID=A0AAW5SPZ3_MYCNV|nr:SDR family NAD(P)-dependent oxidoreductase [Mycolicibacterium novocastrense]KUH70841.1 short-chain dehydrogenase [Mycolicibacterium novocastrense]KUH71182.1 short-chain dehydrogenase [Mycolicibacterium novocastrense]KUH73301.1 short-chain dehydrogenase [Mycolicibacterium novocastrense]MCV7025516.1 SDR family NAD(P)-dependent oxidoreductase [Mycolicibacterium novocastrense]GAT08926.1 retinol dehydrogenase 14 [Mycolicibacterium novocastrense]